MPRRKSAKDELKEPVVLPDGLDRTWDQKFQLWQMKRQGASDLAIDVMKNEMQRQTKRLEKTLKAAKAANEAKRRK